MILIWGIAHDPTTTSVLTALDGWRGRVVFLDQHCFLGAGVLANDVELALQDGRLEAALRWGGCPVELGEVAAAYLRPYDARAFPVAAGARQARAVALDELLWTWADVAECLVVNRPGAMAANGSKPFQSRQIRAAGFAVPETLVTTEPDAVDAFWQRHAEVVYKSLSGVRSIVTRLRPGDRTRLGQVISCPTQFQQYVPGVDVRVHVVGDVVFAARIDSDADDYRYASLQGASVEVRAMDLPDEIAERCLALTRAQRLSVSGIDLRRTPEGRWFCFEVNPSPAFSPFDEDRRIAAAVASMLISASACLPETGAAATAARR